uniref:Uncharacterized protein n=1 Tax=viral metagenome TaxID=1070528 RepID=A0A6C0I5Q3_9ZZZZ
MPQGNMFSSSSSRHQMGSNAITGQNQGGGSKKAGFPYMVGRGYQSSIAFQMTSPAFGHCTTLNNLQTTLFPLVSLSRPVGSTNSYNTYWNIPGTH